MLSLTFSISAQWAGFQPVLGQFWPSGLMFDTPCSKHLCIHKHMLALSRLVAY